MKSSKMLLLTTVTMIAMVGTISAVDYKRGEVDSHGRNLWHKIAERCADEGADLGRFVSNPQEMSVAQQERLAELIVNEDNDGNTPMDVAAERLGKTFNPRCYQLMEIFNKAKQANNQ